MLSHGPPLWPLALRPGQVAFSHDALMVLAGTLLQRPKSVGDRPVQRTSGDDPSAEKYSIARSRSAPLCGPELLFRRSSSLRGCDAGIDAPVVTNDAPTRLRVTTRELERVNVRYYASREGVTRHGCEPAKCIVGARGCTSVHAHDALGLMHADGH